MQHRRDGQKLFLSNLETLVIDEFDTFVDSGMEANIRKLLEQYLSVGPRQVIFASATVTKQMKALAADFFGAGTDPAHDFKELIEKSTHMNLQNLKHEFIHIADYDKIKPLKLLIKEFKKYQRKHNTSAIVFCNSVASARAIEHALSEEGLKTASMHGDIPPRMRERNFEDFKVQKAEVLVATDLASRGLDIPFVSHIINFDFPKSNSDYLHRAGRAGRAGRPGFVLSLYRERDQPVLEAMKDSHETLEPLKIEGGSAYSIRKKSTDEAKPVQLG
jgi:superfamily II DNA/RNA helicase